MVTRPATRRRDCVGFRLELGTATPPHQQSIEDITAQGRHSSEKMSCGSKGREAEKLMEPEVGAE